MELTITIDVENPATLASDLELTVGPFLRDAIAREDARRDNSRNERVKNRALRRSRALRALQQIATAAYIEAAKDRRPPIA